MIRVTRRRFLTLSGGFVVAGCTRRDEFPTGGGSTTAPLPTTVPTTTAPTASMPTSTVVTTATVEAGVVPGDPIVVMVELAGGNDALNTMPPIDDRYLTARPTLALADDEMIVVDGIAGYGLHAALTPIAPLVESGRTAMVAGIGFGDPDRSHFVATDRWLRADRMGDGLGWLGRWLDTLSEPPTSLGACALGSNGGLLLGADRRGTVISSPDAFAFPSDPVADAIRTLSDPWSDEPLIAAAQRAFATSAAAVDEFSTIAGTVLADRDAVPEGFVDLGVDVFRTGLAVAAEIATAGVGARVVSVKGGGFDTHSQQKGVHAALLDDLATGLAGFWEKVDGAGVGHRVLLATHSEFGRRVAENGSEGCDHGAAGLSILMGDGVAARVHGVIDPTDLLDGDLRPVIDPRDLFTACLDWLGGDVERVLGRRYDDTALLV